MHHTLVILCYVRFLLNSCDCRKNIPLLTVVAIGFAVLLAVVEVEFEAETETVAILLQVPFVVDKQRQNALADCVELKVLYRLKHALPPLCQYFG